MKKVKKKVGGGRVKIVCKKKWKLRRGMIARVLKVGKGDREGCDPMVSYGDFGNV